MLGIGKIIKNRFPDRQIYHRSHGHVRYFAITTEMQVAALLIACGIAFWITVSTVNLLLYSRTQILLEQRVASEQIIERESLSRQLEDGDVSSVVEGLNNLHEAVRETRSQLTREQLELERVVAEHERLQRIASLAEADAQTAIEIFRLENERTELARRIENLLYWVAGVVFTFLCGFIFYVLTSRDIKKVTKE